MSDIEHDLPDITVNIIPDIQYLADITPSEVYQVDVNVGDVFSVNLEEPNIIVASPSASVYDMAQLAGYALYAGSASFAVNTILPSGVVSSSTQVQLNQISGSTFAANNFVFPQSVTIGGTLVAQNLQVSSSTIYSSGSTKFGDSANDTHQFTGSVQVNGPISARSITGSFKGDGSQLTGLVTDLRISGSAGSDTISLLTDTLNVVGIHGVTTTVTNNQITIDIPTGFATTASNTFVDDQVISGSLDVTDGIWVMPGIINELTSSYSMKAENIGIINAGIYESGSQQAVTPLLGITRVTSASYALTSSYALNASPSASYALTASYAMNAGGASGGLTSSLLSIDQYYFVGDGTTTNFTVSKTYSDYSLIVSVGGVTFISPNDYTVAGNTISFYEAPYSGSNIFIRGFVNVTNNVTGSFSGSLTGIATRAVTASYIADLVLANSAPVTPKLGSVYFSGSYLYIYDGTQYKSASLN